MWSRLAELAVWRRRSVGVHFVRHLWRRLGEDDVPKTAGMLSYGALLAVVPLATVILAVLAAFPMFDRWSADLQNFVYGNFVPAASETIQQYISQFSEAAAGLPALGIATLVLAALFLMSSIENAFNRIWRVDSARTAVSKFLVYWATLTVAPLLVGASLVLTSYFASLPLIKDTVDGFSSSNFPVQATTFLFSTAAFTAIYMIVPNRRVPLRCAAAGGLVAAVLFEAAKYGFATYISRVPTFEAIYGALAAIPIFLAWMYVSWFVVLLGASLSASLESYRVAGGASWHDGEELVLLNRVAGHLWQAQVSGNGLTLEQLEELEPEARGEQLQRLIRGLLARRLVVRGEDGQWLLARDPQQATLLDLYQSGSFSLLPGASLSQSDHPWDKRLDSTLATVGSQVESGLRVSLKELYVEQRCEEETPSVRSARSQVAR